MNKDLKILFIEDSESDAMLIERELTKGGYHIFSMRIDSKPSLLEVINLHPWDIILADYVLPQFSGINAIKLIRQMNYDIPCIMISGKAGEETAVEAMKAGAADFLLKDSLSRLVPAIEREINEAAMRREKKLVELQLKEKEEQYFKLFESANDAIIILDKDKLVECNDQLVQMLGIEKAEIIGKTPVELSPELQEDGMRSIESASRKFAEAYSGIPLQFEWQFNRKDHTLLSTEITLSHFQVREKKMLMAVIRDITERKLAERKLQLAADILNILNHPGDQVKLVDKILHVIKEATHIEAIGIRLKADLDFPFYATSGFPSDFAELHTTLYNTEGNGRIIRQADGRIAYACLCGCVINEQPKYNPGLFTPGGSFLMGSQEQLYQNGQVKANSDFREPCIKAGYETIALIPLKSGDEIIGLLQLNDSRKNLLTQESVRFFEGIGSSIGIAIKRLHNEEQLRLNEEKMRGIIENSTDAIILNDEQGKVIEWNNAAETLIGFSRREALGKYIWDIQYLSTTPENRTDKNYAALKEYSEMLLRTGTTGLPNQLYVTQIRKPSGILSDLQTRLFSIKTPNGYKIGSINRDISELKKAREVELTNIRLTEALSQTAMDFMGLTVEDDIYGYIVNKLMSFAPETMVFAGPYDAVHQELKFERSAGIHKILQQELNNLADGDYKQLTFPIEEAHIEMLSKGKIEPLPEHLIRAYRSFVITGKQDIPEKLKRQKVYSIGLSDENNFYGLVLLLTNLQQDLNKALIETFISQASVTLTKLNIMSALKKSEHRFSSLFEQNNDIIFTLNQKEEITSINPIGETLITGPFKGGVALKAILSNSAYNRLREIFSEAAKQNEQFCSCEIDINARNGSLLTFQMNFSITYHQNKIFEIFSIARNITTNKMLQNQILSKIIETEEREKKSFAEELHDGLGSLLSTMNIYVGLLQKKEKSEEDKTIYLNELNKMVHEAVNNVRMFANSLTPNVLNDFGLLTAIRLYGEKINATQPGLLQFDLPENLPKIEKIIEINIYRMLMELINNSMKYSGAKQILIRITPEEKNLLIDYSDNGKGFDVEHVLNSKEGGMGVKNIFARAKAINGSCEFDSKIGLGVTVHIKTPRTL